MCAFQLKKLLILLLLFLSGMAIASPKSKQSHLQYESFSDCVGCPEMVLVPGGAFLLGSDETEPGHIKDESPQIEVSVPSFAVSKYEITVDQFTTFAEETGYVDETICLSMNENGGWEHNPSKSWQNPGFDQAKNHPVVCLSWNAANAYVDWLNKRSSSAQYRLLSESEWEYVARAGSSSIYWWGDNEDEFCKLTNGVDQLAQARFPGWKRAGKCSDGFVFTAPVGHYQSPNAFGLEDLVGNVWEWVEDCYADSYANKPRDGSPYKNGSCEKGVLRGGAWGDTGSFYLRSAYRGAWTRDQSFTNLGFRVAKSMVR